MSNILLNCAFALIALLICAPALADVDNGMTADVPSSAPATKSTVPLTTGGIGEDMDRLRNIQNQYNLKLLITEKNGIFLSDVAVQIRDRKGNVVADTTTDGPVLLARLAPGTYQIKATRQNGESKEFKAHVGSDKLHAYQVAFKDTDERDSGDPRTVSLK